MRTNHPPRTLHLVDIENLVGDPRPAIESVRRARSAYEAHVLVGDDNLGQNVYSGSYPIGWVEASKLADAPEAVRDYVDALIDAEFEG